MNIIKGVSIGIVFLIIIFGLEINNSNEWEKQKKKQLIATMATPTNVPNNGVIANTAFNLLKDKDGYEANRDDIINILINIDPNVLPEDNWKNNHFCFNVKGGGVNDWYEQKFYFSDKSIIKLHWRFKNNYPNIPYYYLLNEINEYQYFGGISNKIIKNK